MANSEWDKHLRDSLGDFKSDGETPHWEELAHQLDSSLFPSEEPHPLQDENLRDNLSNYKVSSEIEGWERIQASLDAADREFDENVRRKIHHYGPPFDPMAWPVFLKRISESKLLRVKLIALKVVEATAVFLLLFTALNMERLGTLNFNTASSEKKPETNFSPQHPYTETDLNSQSYMPGGMATLEILEDNHPIPHPSDPNASGQTTTAMSSSENKVSVPSGNNISTYSTAEVLNHPEPLVIKWNETTPGETSSLHEVSNPALFHPETQMAQNIGTADVTKSVHGLDEDHITATLATLDFDVNIPDADGIPKPKYVNQPASKYLEFGIVFQTDYNRLRMPEDKFFTSGRQIVFPQRGIPSQGFGAGFTIGIGHPLWALETGIIYSAKEFKPGRHLVVGDVFDNGSVDFEAMRLQLVSLPFQYRYRFEPKGRLKTYAIAGFGLHVIVQSDIDVLIKYNFPSLSIGENPNHDPNLANTIRETRRISEHFRDGAPLSTKSFLSVNAGLGMEYSLPHQKTLFLQTALQYQIPNLRFSNNSGKQIQTISLQAGVRTPLGT